MPALGPRNKFPQLMVKQVRGDAEMAMMQPARSPVKRLQNQIGVAWVVLAVACAGSTAPTDAGSGTDSEPSEVPPDIALDAAPDGGTGETGPGLGIDYASTDPGAAPRYDPESTDWTATGWPSDRYRNEDGQLDLSIFPNPGISLVMQYLAYGMVALDGYGLNGSVYFQLDSAPDMEGLPEAGDSMDPMAIAQLVNVTPGSARYGELSPLRFGYYDTGGDPYFLPNTLAMRPVFGRPLAEGETYCAILTRGILDAQARYLQQAPGFVAALDTEPSLSPLVAWLVDSPLHTEDIAVATCFTTQHATAELRAVQTLLQELEAPTVVSVSEPLVFNEFHGIYSAPNFQEGEKPYDENGGLELDAEGVPIVQSQEELRFMMLVPRDRPMPEAGWPVVLYAHGTGGDYESCRGVDAELMAEGYAILCIDQPLHGTRSPDPTEPLSDDDLVFKSFNFLNPPAGRTNFRQSAIDTMVLSRMVAEGRFDMDGGQTLLGETVVLDPENIAFLGHSHGGLSGGMVLGLDPHIRAGMLSGAGGGIINTILLRKDPFDVGGLVRNLLLVDSDDFDSFHPTLTLIQMLVDATDPLNYAPYWTHPFPGGTAKEVLVTEGTLDHATPGISADSMVAAAGIPFLTPIARTNSAHDVQGLTPLDMPVSGNVEGPLTAASKQWQDGNHWVAFNNGEAEAIWVGFFRTLLDEGPAVLDRHEETLRVSAPTPMADTCEMVQPLDLALLPLRVAGNTSLATDAYGHCDDVSMGAGQRDGVFAFTADVAGTYHVRLITPPTVEPEDEDEEPLPTGPDLLSVVGECGDATEPCLAETEEGAVSFDLDGGQKATVIVDGSTPAHVGPFTLNVTRLCEAKACGERVCGQWGCESCGKCAPGSVCTAEGQCVTSQPGDDCGAAFVVDTLPFVANGATTGFNPDYHYEKGWCSGENAKFGEGSSDVAYQWTVPSDGRYELKLDADYDAQMYVVTDCDDIANTCMHADRDGGDGEELSIQFEAGQTVFIIVDGAYNNSNKHGNYTFRLDACVPDCAEKTCGKDGCGGSCGTCPAMHRCDDEPVCVPIEYVCDKVATCEVITAGDTCEAAHLIEALPYTHASSTKELIHDYAYGKGACPGESNGYGGSAADAAYAYTADSDGIVRFKINTDWDSNLYVVSDCGNINGTCLRAHQREKKGGEVVYVNLVTGQTVHAIVDGASKTGHAGPYKLSVSACTPSCADKVCGSDGCGGGCGKCAHLESCKSNQCVVKNGSSCEAPLQASKVPYDDKRKTSDYADVMESACGNSVAGESDVIHRFLPPESTDYRVWFDEGFAGRLSVLAHCGGGADACLGQSEATDSIELFLSQATPVFVVVEGQGEYTLRIDKVCVPQCEDKECGDDGCGSVCGTCVAPTDVCAETFTCLDPGAISGSSCGSAFGVDLDALPFEGEGDTETAFNQYAFSDGFCPGFVGKGGASNDQVWRLSGTKAGTYTITLTAEFQAALYAVTDCDDINGSCMAAADDRDTERLMLTLGIGESVFLIVDGASNALNQTGHYRLVVTGEGAQE